MLASGDLSGTLADIAVPTGFVIGSEDQVTPAAQTDAAAAAVARALGTAPPVETIARAGHAVYLQRPAAFAEALTRLIHTLTETARDRRTA
jgi:pimeloyl-ACP methyl ester carboxylesterase